MGATLLGATNGTDSLGGCCLLCRCGCGGCRGLHARWALRRLLPCTDRGGLGCAAAVGLLCCRCCSHDCLLCFMCLNCRSTDRDCTKWTFCPLTAEEGCAAAAAYALQHTPVAAAARRLAVNTAGQGAIGRCKHAGQSPGLLNSHVRTNQLPPSPPRPQVHGTRRAAAGRGLPPRHLPAEQCHSWGPPDPHRLQLYAGEQRGSAREPAWGAGRARRCVSRAPPTPARYLDLLPRLKVCPPAACLPCCA